MVTVSVGHLLLGLKAFNQSQNGNGLDCFAETHLVGQDAIEIRLVQFEEPVKAFQLVLSEHSALDGVGLLLDLEYLDCVIVMIKFLHRLHVDLVADLVPLQRLPL